MDAPQQDAEVFPVVQALRRLDYRLDIIWNPRAVMVRRGGYDVVGRVTDPTYDGRWEVILRDSPNKTANWREHERVCLVTEPVTLAGGLMAMQEDGPYAPVGWWLVEYLEAADSWNHIKAEYLADRLDDLNTALDARRLAKAEDAEREAAARLFHAGTVRGGVSESHPVNISFDIP